MSKIVVVTNRNRQEVNTLRQQLQAQYPAHELIMQPTYTCMMKALLSQPASQWPQLIFLDQYHTNSDTFSSLKELKADSRFRHIPVLMLGAIATYHKMRQNPHVMV
nr:hypothetical protein [uncultured Arsenicibacter sp.]